MENIKYKPKDTGRSKLEVLEECQESIQYGPHVSELIYQEGGMSTLIGEAMLGKEGKVRLTPDDLNNVNRIGLIHPILRDVLARGDSIDIRSTGHQDIIHPKPHSLRLYLDESL